MDGGRPWHRLGDRGATVSSIGEYVEPDLYRLIRESGVQVWIACANGITLMSYSEQYARDWLAAERGDGPEAA